MKTDEFYAFTAPIVQTESIKSSTRTPRFSSLPLIIMVVVLVTGCGFYWKKISAASSDLSQIEDIFQSKDQDISQLRNPIYDLVISPFGSALLYRDHQGKVFQQNLVTEKESLGSVTDLFPGKSCEGMKISPVENKLVATFSTGELCLQDLDSMKEPILLLEPSTRIIESMAFSPDGRLLAAAMDVGTVLVWDTQTLQTVSIIRGKNTTAFSVLFDTSSSLLISFENGLERWVFRESNNAERPLRKKRDWRINQSIAREMVVTSDGRYLLTSSFDSKLTCWDLETQQVKWEQRASLPCVRSVEISRDEKTFVCHADANTITVRDMETGEPEVWLMDQDMGTGTGARFSLDGNLLYTTSSDGLVRIWTIPGQSLIGTIVTTSL